MSAMQPKQPRYLFYALQAFVVFGALSFLWHGPMLWPWLATPIGWIGALLNAVENGIFGAVFVSVIVLIYYKIVVPQPSNAKRRKLLITGIVLIALAFAWFIPALKLAGRWFPDPAIADQVALWPFLILSVFGAALVGKPLSGWFRPSKPSRDLDEP
jgi:hypothetical protein